MEVFSLKANEWRSSQYLHGNFSLCVSFYSFTNALLHWLVDLHKDPLKMCIIAFYLGEEKLLPMARIGELSSGVENNELVNAIIGEGSSHGREFLVGRLGHIKKAKESTKSTSNVKNFSISKEALEQIKMEVKLEVKNEIKEEVRNEVTEEVSAHFKLMLERFILLNPSFNLNLDVVMATTEAQSSHFEE